MPSLKATVLAAAFGVVIVGAPAIGIAQTTPAHNAKNWTAPAAPIYAQKLSDAIMAKHPELLSLTFHGVPPGQVKTYTMFAGSYPERIGNPDDPDDIDVSVKGITILDPRWHRTNDTSRKFVVLMPLRDAKGENIGLLVPAFKNDEAWGKGKGEREFFAMAMDLRDSIQKQIPNYAALFAPAR